MHISRWENAGNREKTRGIVGIGENLWEIVGIRGERGSRGNSWRFVAIKVSRRNIMENVRNCGKRGESWGNVRKRAESCEFVRNS